MRLVLHLGRAALVFWVAAILLPAAVVDATASTRQQPSPRGALQGVSSTADDGRTRLGELTDRVHVAEEDVRHLVARVRLETERFIAGLP